MPTIQHHAVTIAPKNWELGECSEPRKSSVFGRRIGSQLKKLKGFFLGGEYVELGFKKSE